MCAATSRFPSCPAAGGPGRAVPRGATADLWTERLHLTGAEAVATYSAGPQAGFPAITRHTYGSGTTWYVASHPDPATLTAVLDRLRAEAAVQPEADAPAGIEVVRRRGTGAGYLFLIDHIGEGGE